MPRSSFRAILAAVLAVLPVLTACGPADVPAPETSATLTVEGRIAAADGTAPAAAHVHLVKSGEFRPETTAAAEADGSFRIEVPRGIAWELRLDAVGHERSSLPLVVGESIDTLELDASLAPARLDTPVENVWITGDWMEHGTAPGDVKRMPMERRDDGTFVYIVEGAGETVSYQVTTVEGGKSFVHGTQADAWTNDGLSGYRSVVDTVDGKAEIVFDPARFAPPAPEHPLPRFETSGPDILVAGEIAEAFDRVSRARMKAMIAKETFDGDALKAEAERLTLAALHDESASAALRAWAAANALGRLSVDEADRTLALGLLGADSPYWTVAKSAVRRLGLEEHGDLVARLRAEHPDPGVKAYAVAAYIDQAKENGDDDAWRELYGELEGYKETSFWLRLLLKELKPDRKIAAGKPVPDFEAPLFESAGDGATVSRASLAGSHFLVEFWGTWCAPCVAEMPELHAAWETYGGKGLRMLSVARDSEEKVREFRAGDWPMPWFHVVYESGGALLEAFEVEKYPTTILVDPAGTIVAVDDGLHGEALLATLAANLDGP